MRGALSIQAVSKEIWEEAKPHVLAVLMYVTQEPRAKILENSTGCTVKLDWFRAQKGFRLLLEQLRSKKFPVKLNLGVELKGSPDDRRV